MSIEWTDAAVRAAIKAWYFDGLVDAGAEEFEASRAALTAAAEAQGLTAPTPQPVGERRWVSMVPDPHNAGTVFGIASDGTAWVILKKPQQPCVIRQLPAPEATP